MFGLNMPMELKIMVINYTKFEIEKDLPFGLRFCYGWNDKQVITNKSEEIVTFDKKNMKFGEMAA